MRKKGALIFLCALLMASVWPAFSSGEPADFRYHFSTKIKLSRPADLFLLCIDPAVYATMDPSLRDLRLYHGEEELSYVILSPPPSGVNLSYLLVGGENLPLEARKVTWSIVQENSESEKKSTLTIDLRYENRPSRGIKLVTEDKGFLRDAAIEASNDGKNWTFVTSATFYRSQGGQKEELAVSYPLLRARYLRVTVNNGNNPPVRFTGAVVELVPVVLLVKAPTTSFLLDLYWGNDRLSIPFYDLADVLAREGKKIDVNSLTWVEVKDFEVIRNGEVEEKPPLSERLPWLIPVTLGTAALVVVLFLVRTVKYVNRQ